MPSATVRHLLAIGKVQQISKKTYRLLSPLAQTRSAVSAAVLAAGGYDGAVSSRPADYFEEVYEMRLSGKVLQMWQYVANTERRAAMT